jgi:hypothetical protein
MNHIEDHAADLRKRAAYEQMTYGATREETWADIDRFNEFARDMGFSPIGYSTVSQRRKGLEQARERSFRGVDITNPRADQNMRERLRLTPAE